MSEPRMSFEVGFAPDADPLRPGVLTDCHNFVPGPAGMETLLLPYAGNAPAGTAASEALIGYGFALKDFSESAADEFAGTGTKLYHKDWFTGAWSDASRTAGYTSTEAQVWSFERFGNYVLAAARPLGPSLARIPLQARTTSGTAVPFTDIPGAPTCSVITSADRFVLAFNGQNGAQDSWACCARDNHTSWTTSPSTLANAGQLVDPPGAITAAAPLGNDVIVHKNGGMVFGSFVEGDREVWKWRRLPHKVGAVGPRAVATTHDGKQVFIASDSCYLFDGSTLIDLLDSRAKRWFMRARNSGPLAQHSAHYDPRTGCAWFCFPPNGTADLIVTDAATIMGLVVHIPTGRIGKVQLGADLVALMPVGGNVPGTGWFDNVTHAQWFNYTSDNVLNRGAMDNSIPGFTDVPRPFVITGDFGDRWDLVQVDGFRADVARSGEDGFIGGFVYSRDTRRVANQRELQGSPLLPGHERFSARANAHWHRVMFTTTRAVELTGVTFDTPKFGGRRK